MFFLRRIYIVFLAFFTYYQYAMKESDKKNDVTENNEQNKEAEDKNSLENFENEQSEFTLIFREQRNNLDEKIAKEENDINSQKYELEERLEKLEHEKNNLNQQKYEDSYKLVEQYVSRIRPRVVEKCKEIDKVINEEIEKKERNGGISPEKENSLRDFGEAMKQKFYESLKTCFRTEADILLRPRVMCDDKRFSDGFNMFKGRIDDKIKHMPFAMKFLQNNQQFEDFMESERRRYRLYRFFRNALYRQGYLLFYNTARVISNVKIEYDLWHSDTGKHIWGFNSSANVYYKYRSAWNYRVFKFNLFYIEFSFGLFHLLLKPLKRISKWGSVLYSHGGDYLLNASEAPFWDMINISLVQISVGPVKINGLGFSLFDPLFFVMSLCLAKYLGLFSRSRDYIDAMFRYLNNYKAKTISVHEKEDKDGQNKIKIYKLKEVLKKFNFVERGSYSAFIMAFRSYLFKKSILFNIIHTWKEPYHYEFYIDIVLYTFVEILKSAPECFKELLSSGEKPTSTIHEAKIIDTYYLDSRIYTPACKHRCSFCGRCDMFFLSLALLVYSMIDSISIDLRWFIENESVRKYCARIKRKVCKFFQG